MIYIANYITQRLIQPGIVYLVAANSALTPCVAELVYPVRSNFDAYYIRLQNDFDWEEPPGHHLHAFPQHIIACLRA